MVEYVNGHTFEVTPGEIASGYTDATMQPGWYAQLREHDDTGEAAGPFQSEVVASLWLFNRDPRKDEGV